MWITINKKIFYWIFGLVFSIIVYLLVHHMPFFSNLKEIWYLELVLPLIIIFLFFVVGCLISKISKISLLLLAKKDKVKLNAIENMVNSENSEEQINKLVTNIKKLISFIIKEKYSKESIKHFVEYIGMDFDTAENIIRHIKKIRTVRYIYWIFGFLLSVCVYFLIILLPNFLFLKETLIPLAISLVIFCLFFVEGFLVIRLPQSFYLNLLGIKDIKLLNQQKQMVLNKAKKQQEHITNIKNTIRYLLKIKTDSEFIKKLLVENGFSKQVAESILTNLIKEDTLDSNKEVNLPSTANEKMTKLFLSKIHDEFLSLKEVYGQINEINKKIDFLEKRQKKFINNNTNGSNKANVISSENITLPKNFNLKIESKTEKEKYEKYMKQIRFLFEFLKPYAKKYTKSQLESFLVSQEYNPEIITDVMNEFKKEGVDFVSTENLQTKVVNFINDVYSSFSKKKS